VRRSAFARYTGQGHEIEIELPDRDLADRDVRMIDEVFERTYRALYGRTIANADIEILSWAAFAAVEAEGDPQETSGVSAAGHTPSPVGETKIFEGRLGAFVTAGIYWRDDLAPGAIVEGPAVIAEDQTSTIVTGSFSARIDERRYIVLQRRR
jgi:N-methylhydantoinase A